MENNIKDLFFRNEQIKEKGGGADKYFLEFGSWILSIVVPLIIGLIGNIINWDWTKAHWQEYMNSHMPVVIGFVSVFGKFMYNIFRHYEYKNKKQFDQIFQNKEIIVKIDIDKFDNSHVKVIQEIFNQLNPKDTLNEVFVLDNSHPAQWWSESMLAYLAVQSSWIRNSENKKLHRFFVLDTSELATNEAKKIIAFHILMGFETYVLKKKSFDSIFNEFNKQRSNGDKVDKKEFFVWNGNIENQEKDKFGNPSYSCEIRSIHKIYNLGKKVIGYQSLWSLDTPYHQRKDGNFFKRMNGEDINISKWQVKFEFILPEYEKNRLSYIAFSKYLISKSKICRVSSNLFPDDIIIKIPAKNIDGTPIEVDCINGIIESFNNK